MTRQCYLYLLAEKMRLPHVTFHLTKSALVPENARQNFALNLKSREKDDNTLKYNFGFRKQLKLFFTRIYVSKLNIHIRRPGECSF